MNDLPRQRLHELVARRSKIKATKHRDPVVHAATFRKQLQKLVGDDHITEVNVLTAAVRDQIPADIKAWPHGTPIAEHLDRLSARLAEHHALREDAARWAVEAWAEALGVLEMPEPEHAAEPESSLFFSTWDMQVLKRSMNDPLASWEPLPDKTPGSVSIPPQCDLGLRPAGVKYTNLRLWTESFDAPERVRYLDLSGARLIDSAVESLRCFTNLEVLNLASTSITGEGLVHLAALPLKELNLANCNMLSDQGLSSVSKLSQLRHVDLSRDTAITHLGIQHLQQLPQLHTLILDGCATLSEEVLAQLAVFPQLEELDLSRTSMTGIGLLYFRRNRKLRILALDGCRQLQDDHVAHLLHLGSLESLALQDNAITDRALDHVAKLPELRWLYLHNCMGVSQERITALRNQGISVILNHRPPITLGSV